MCKHAHTHTHNYLPWQQPSIKMKTLRMHQFCEKTFKTLHSTSQSSHDTHAHNEQNIWYSPPHILTKQTRTINHELTYKNKTKTHKKQFTKVRLLVFDKLRFTKLILFVTTKAYYSTTIFFSYVVVQRCNMSGPMLLQHQLFYAVDLVTITFFWRKKVL